MVRPPFPVEWLDLPDDKLGLHLFVWWIGAQAEGMGISPNRVPLEVAEKIRLATLGVDTDNPRYTALEKALQRVARGDAAGGGKLFRESMRDGALHLAALDEATTGKRRQQRNARKPRVDGLQYIILQIVEAEPKIDQEHLILRLREYEGRGVIETVSDAEQFIEWTDKNNRVESTDFSALKHRVSRARKVLKSR